MTDKRKITTIALLAILAIGVGSIAFSITDNTSEVYGKVTNPAEFTNLEYGDLSVDAQFITIDPVEISQHSEYVIHGKISDVNPKSILLAPIDPKVVDENGVPREPRIDATEYTVKVNNQYKGDYDHKNIVITSLFPSKIGYEIGDEILVMAVPIGDTYQMVGGPHSMFKIKQGEAIGHENTFPEQALINAIKAAENKRFD